MRSLLSVLAASAALSGIAGGTLQQQVPFMADFVCEHPPYKSHIVSRSPLVIYITDFLTPQERLHLQEVTKDTFAHSSVTSGSQHSHHRVRTSQSSSVHPDAMTRCIEDRALAFQGFTHQRSHLEPLQLVRYAPGEEYRFHTDWFTDATHAGAGVGGNRVSSFFAYVAVANGTTGGGTNFPMLEVPTGREWCDNGWVDCDEEWERGVTFRPVEGNAVFWENLVGRDGAGDQRTLHAGLPVTAGSKIGMNIWTREGPLGEDIRGTAS